MIPPIEGFNSSARKDVIAFVVAVRNLSQNGIIKDLQ